MSPNSRTSAAPVFRLLLVPLLLGGCGALRRSDPAPDLTHDPRIQGQVEARLAREPALSGRAIRVEVEGRTVVLHGSVAGIAAWQCALRNAGLVEGVASVVDYLVIERGPRDSPCLAPRAAPTVQGGDRTADTR